MSFLRRIVSSGAAAAAVLGADIPAAAQVVEQGAFVMLMGSDTFAIENFTRTATGIEGEITGRAIGRMEYRATVAPDASVPELTLRAWAPGSAPDASPMQEARLTVHGDSVIGVITTAAGSQTQRIASHAGVLIYLNPSFVLTEQIVRRARVVGGEPAHVPIFIVQGGQTLDAVVARPAPDSVSITIAGSPMRGRVAEGDRLTAITMPAQNLEIRRVDGPVAAVAPQPPDYSAPADAPYHAEEVRIATAAGHTLAGTLTRPRGAARVGAVVMITGSGAQDRDQAIPAVRGYRPFRAIADTLSRRGVAVLRLDDRGYGASTGDFATATSADFGEDVRAALAYLRARPDIDAGRLGLVGHSEGGLIAPLVAADDTTLAGIVVIAGPSQTGRQIIRHQQRLAIEHSPTVPAESRDSAAAEAQRQLEELAGTSPWMRFFLDYEPLPTARRVRRTPVLILHGETDWQVTVEQAHELAAAFRDAGNADVTVRTFADINHLLLHDADGNPAGYAALDGTAIARDVLGALADWTAARLGGAPQ